MEHELTGYPSIDKPWLKYYSDEAINAPLPEGTVYEYLWRSNKDHPDDVAIIYFNTKITYAQLFSQIGRVERALRFIGVASGDIVTISMPATPETIYLFYALCKIGAIANMIDPRADADELCHYLQEAESKVYFFLDRCKPIVELALPRVGVKTAVSMSPTESLPFLRFFNHAPKVGNAINWRSFLKNGELYPQAADTAGNAAAPILMTHTSGTTGKPKGVVLSSKNVNAVAHQYEVKISHERGQSYLCVIPPFIAFGVCVAIHMPISLGVASVLIPQFDPRDFLKLLRKYRPEHLVCTPSHYESLLNDPSDIDLSFLLSPGAGGDSMEAGYERNVNEYLRKHGCKSDVLNGYGMTEVSSTSCLCWTDCNAIGSVGIPLVNMTLSVFEIGTTKELPYREQGEICFTGPNVMQGYYKNPEATAATLKKHEDGSLWVHSGDVGYMTEEGMVYVVDRLKRAINVDGQRVFPSTIESILLKNEAVNKCAVVGDKTGKLFAHVVLCSGYIPDTVRSELARMCEAELPKYELPTEYVFRAALPLTPVGKVDFRALENEAK